jgi:hypothetical protein
LYKHKIHTCTFTVKLVKVKENISKLGRENNTWGTITRLTANYLSEIMEARTLGV